MRKRMYILLAVLAVSALVGAISPWMSEPAGTSGAGGYVMFRQSIRDYRQETGDYPKNARELVEKLGPRMAAGGGAKVSYLRDDRVLLQGAGSEVEVEYFYLSADTMPKVNCILK